MIRAGLSAIALSFIAAVASASGGPTTNLQTTDGAQGGGAVQGASPCSAGIVYDDGTYESAYGLGPGTSAIAMKLGLPAGTTTFDQVCIAFTRTSGAPSSLTFDIVVYDDDGSGGSPGNLLGSVSKTISQIPIFPSYGFYTVDFTGSGIVLPSGSVYVGARYQASYFSGTEFIDMLGDRSGSTSQRSNYGSTNGGSSWSSMSTIFPSAPPRAMAIRADPVFGSPSCTPSATKMCLNNNRFEVTATWQTSSANGVAQTVKLTDDTGYLWFFQATNVEAVVKVLNACGLNSRYWVFAGGLTNQRAVITVRDTVTGLSKTYINPLNTPFQPIQDTNALATCP